MREPIFKELVIELIASYEFDEDAAQRDSLSQLSIGWVVSGRNYPLLILPYILVCIPKRKLVLEWLSKVITN